MIKAQLSIALQEQKLGRIIRQKANLNVGLRVPSDRCSAGI